MDQSDGCLLSGQPPEVVHSHAVITLPAKKGVIASQLNLTHEHFSRLLHEIEAAGLIQVDGREILISDIGRLRTCPAVFRRTEGAPLE
jgi:CRP-like cAMP-binding protein